MAGDFNNDFNNDFTIDEGQPSDGELKVNDLIIPDMMIGNTRVAEVWVNGIRVFNNVNY